MTTQTDLDGLYEVLEQNPQDWVTYLILADWYEENGQQGMAEAVRWQVKNDKRPNKYETELGDYVWYRDAYQSKNNDSTYADLPAALIDKMRYKYDNAHWAVHKTVRDTLHALYEAFQGVPEKDLVVRYKDDQ